MEKPLVSVVIVNWNGLDDTKLCLAHTHKQTYKDIEIIVVDNGSTDGSVNYLRSLSDIVLVENPTNRGFTGGHIAGYRAAKGKYILLLNNDAVMEEHYIERAVDIMQMNDTIGAVGGRAYLWDDNNPLLDVTNDFYAYQNINPITAEGIFTKIDEGVLQEVNTVSGSCVMVRRSVIENIGYLHNPFFAYYEESDLFARMKRVGYRVMYSPELAIWHANGKSAQRKAPTFSYYMMMRNRFGFAVRNFDGWSLRRFLKFYLKMGIVSIIKSILPVEQRPMHIAYARAFFYNALWGWRSFKERYQLQKISGSVSYNEIITLEQTGVSIILECDSKSSVDACVELAKSLPPLSEVIMVAEDPSTIRYAKTYAAVVGHAPLRLCVNKKLFDTHPLNLGAVCAKNNWLVLLSNEDADNSELVATLHKTIYQLKQNKHKLGAPSHSTVALVAPEKALSVKCSSTLLIQKSLFIDSGGLLKELVVTDALRGLLAYAALSQVLALIKITGQPFSSLPSYGSQTLPRKDLLLGLHLTLQDVRATQRASTLFDKVLARFYRLAQFTHLTQWILSPKITLRLKLARTKNLLFAVGRLRRQELALELKHIRNEVIKSRRPILDLEKRKKEELKLLAHLSGHPQETPIFIITRDRLEPLKQLLAWLEGQGLKRIVFVDNDSALPTLTEYLLNTPYQVLEMGRNAGHKVVWDGGVVKVLLPDSFYVVTDPDVIPATKSPTLLPYLYELHRRYPNYLKVGLGLKIDDLPDHYMLKDEVIRWESQFWKTAMEDKVFEAGVDTTFALYKPYTYTYTLHPSLRTGEPYVARHLPWYANNGELSNEDVFYRLRADQNVNSWNKDQLPERYARELARERH